MKMTIKTILIMAGLTSFSAAVMASEVGTITTFSDGNVLTAAQLNDNNTSIITAVNDNNSHHKVYALRDTGPAGGLVFHIENGGRNGLEAAPGDQDGGSGVQWGCDGVNIDGAEGALIGRGYINTLDVMEQCSEANRASKLAYDYISPSGYTDWFLPSQDELYQMYTELHLNGVGDFASNHYWSSSEYSAGGAQGQFFSGGSPSVNPKASLLRVRSIRAF